MDDVERGRELFIEEANELTATLEQTLLELERRPEDKELIGGIFRALHTIKGSGAMFGFEELSSFAHELETVYHDIRSGRLAVTEDIINMSLSAVDRIKKLVENTPSGEPPVLEEFNIAGSAEPHAGKSPLRRFEIKFKPSADVFLRGINPLSIINDIRELGDCSVRALTDGLPGLTDMNPEHCYTEWDISLETERDENAIRDVVVFVENDCEIKETATAKKGAGEERSAEIEGASRTEAGDVQSIRVHSWKLDRLMNLVGELVTVQARLRRVASSKDDPEVFVISETVERLTEELRDNTMQLRMVPIGTISGKLRRMVRDLAMVLGKEVELKVEGAETELDKTMIEKIREFIVHIIRNSVDHGIEGPAEREAAGKKRKGLIHLWAGQSGPDVVVRIKDDGRGIDPGRIREKAVRGGLITGEDSLSENELLQMVFAPGFSTSESITSVSGRGVGLDVVKKGIESLRGSVEIESSYGKGMTIAIKVPLTLAIIEGLLVRVAEECFVVPLQVVEECIDMKGKYEAGGVKRIVNIRGEAVPYINLREHFNLEGEGNHNEQAVVCRLEDSRVGLVVDEFIGDYQTVIKPLNGFYKNIQGISGATILGDGGVALILDVERLLKIAENAENQSVSGKKEVFHA